MATISHVNTRLTGFQSRDCNSVIWETLTSANAIGDACEIVGGRDLTVHIIGTFDSATVIIEGSINGTNWATLTDPQGNAISKTTASMETISEVPRYIRPSVSGGGASQDLDVLLLMRMA